MYEAYAKLRDEKHMTDYSVAKDVGLRLNIFSEWKNGKSKPKVDKLKKLADYFGVTIEYFLEETEREQP